MKRFALTIFTAALSMVLFSIPAFAETSGDFEYDILDNGTVEITEYYGSDSDVAIPNQIDGKDVTSIADSAFEGNSSIESISIPATIKSFGIDPFFECELLHTVYYQGTIDDWYNIQFDGNGTPCANGAKLYINGTLLETAAIPEGTKTVAGFFEGCTSLKSVTIPESAITISSRAFEGCTSLESITIPTNIVDVMDFAFQGCTSLESITIPGSVTHLGPNTFAGCTSLKSAAVFSNVKKLPMGIFANCPALKNVELPQSLTAIGPFAFQKCKSLQTIQIPDAVTTIEAQAFYNCASLQAITIPSNVETVGMNSFASCTALKAISIPASVTTIEDWAFNKCSALSSATISSPKTKVGEDAFPVTTTIRCHADSKAETWAKAHGNKIEYLSNHAWVTVKGYAAKVGFPGLTDGIKCSKGGEWKVKQTVIAAKNPAAVKLSSVKKKGKKAFVAKWAKSTSANATGCQIRYSLKSSMKSAKTVTVKGWKTASKVVKKLKSGKKYYVQVRVYKNGKDAAGKAKTYYSQWSAKKSVKVA